jgi:hypothetical protein
MKLSIIALVAGFALSYAVVAVAQSGSSTMPTGVRESGITAAEPMNGRTTTSGATGPTMMNGATNIGSKVAHPKRRTFSKALTTFAWCFFENFGPLQSSGLDFLRNFGFAILVIASAG